MNGIWVAVKATTWYRLSPRKTTLKLWKSRPAAPMIITRRGIKGPFQGVRTDVMRGKEPPALRHEPTVRTAEIPSAVRGSTLGLSAWAGRSGGAAALVGGGSDDRAAPVLRAHQADDVGPRHAEGEGGALARLGYQPQPARHGLDQLAGDIQAEARAPGTPVGSVLHPEEPVEHPVLVRQQDPGAPVSHGDDAFAAHRVGADLYRGVRRGEGDRALGMLSGDLRDLLRHQPGQLDRRGVHEQRSGVDL